MIDNSERILTLLDQIEEACRRATSFVEGLDYEAFMSDERTQQAVAMSLMVIGEAVSRLHARHRAFLDQFPNAPWQNMRGMRNRIAHGYFDLDLKIVFDTAVRDLPILMTQLPSMFAAASRPTQDDA